MIGTLMPQHLAYPPHSIERVLNALPTGRVNDGLPA